MRQMKGNFRFCFRCIDSLFFYKIVFIFFVMGLCTGCLRTRADLEQEVEQKKEMKTQLSTLQQSAARDEVRFQDYETQFRELNGKIEVLEHQLNESRQQRDEALKTNATEKAQGEERLKLYEESLRSLEAQTQRLNQELDQLKTEKAALATGSQQNGGKASGPHGNNKKDIKSEEKGSYRLAEEAYGKKDWKSAIVSYQKYRESNPKGKYYATATFKIGICFKELGMAADAKPFFQEVIEKFPHTKEATQAKSHLKSGK